jgi:uncharacterized membrane protein YedE/YeeE
METRFGALSFLCNLQVIVGWLVIIGSLVFLANALLMASDARNPPTPPNEWLVVAGIVTGGVFIGLSIIAMAQAYQCLMQIEINTRPSQIPDNQK